MAETKRYYCVSGGACSVEWLETERDVIRAIRDVGDWGAVAVYETHAPTWGDCPDEERLIAAARRQQDEADAVRDRVELGARAIHQIESGEPWEELHTLAQHNYAAKARAVLDAAGAARGQKEGSADAG